MDNEMFLYGLQEKLNKGEVFNSYTENFRLGDFNLAEGMIDGSVIFNCNFEGRLIATQTINVDVFDEEVVGLILLQHLSVNLGLDKPSL